MVTEHLNFKKTETCFSACLKSHFLYCSQFHNLHVKTTAIHKAAHKAAFINFSALKCGVYSRAAFNQNKYGMLLKETPKMENVIRHQTHVVVFASSFPWSYQQRLLLYVISIDLALANKGLNFIVITFTMDFNDEWCKLKDN